MSEKASEIIEIRPVRDGWEVFEIGGIRPFYRREKYAIDYALSRAVGREVEIHVIDKAGAVVRVIRPEDLESGN